MSEQPEHTYTRETMIDRLTEIMDIFYDDRSEIGDITGDTQHWVGSQIALAVDALKRQ